MRILYAIQGTGNGHITVAREVLPLLRKHAEVDILISGTQVDVDLPWPVTYRLHGMSFIFGKNGGIDYLETFRKSRIRELFREIRRLPVQDYDLVISDFEPVSAWACYLKGKTCIGFSHQAAVVCKQAPRAEKADPIGKAVLKHYAPATVRYGFHFVPYGPGVYTPIIRSELRSQPVRNEGHYTVYLPSYSNKKIRKLLSCFPGVRWEVFSKHSTETLEEEGIRFQPVDHAAFVTSLASCAGVLCNSGFQTPSEALFLKKKLLVVPMKGQYEQQCNAAALRLLGVPVLKNIKPKQYSAVKEWLETDSRLHLEFPDETEYIVDEILHQFAEGQVGAPAPRRPVEKASEFRKLLLKKIFYQLGA